MATPSRDRAPRKDAARNCALLIAAAVAAFQEDGLGASVNAIAADAGVNIATLYRHFPTKDDLLVAVFDQVLAPLEIARDRALAGAPGRSLETFLREAVHLQAEHRGLIEAITRAAGSGGVQEIRARLKDPALAIVEPLAQRAHRDGELRDDFDAADLLIALRMASGAAVAAVAEPATLERYVDVVVRGLRPD